MIAVTCTCDPALSSLRTHRWYAQRAAEVDMLEISQCRERRKKRMAPQVGFEPTTLRLTAECSTIELLRSVEDREGRDLQQSTYHSIPASGLKTLHAQTYRQSS